MYAIKRQAYFRAQIRVIGKNYQSQQSRQKGKRIVLTTTLIT